VQLNHQLATADQWCYVPLGRHLIVKVVSYSYSGTMPVLSPYRCMVKLLKSATRGQWNARPTVTFSAAERRRRLTGMQLYLFVAGVTKHGLYSRTIARTVSSELLGKVSLFVFVSVPCARLSWPQRLLLSARKYTVSHRIVLTRILHRGSIIWHAFPRRFKHETAVSGERVTLRQNVLSGFVKISQFTLVVAVGLNPLDPPASYAPACSLNSRALTGVKPASGTTNQPVAPRRHLLLIV